MGAFQVNSCACFYVLGDGDAVYSSCPQLDKERDCQDTEIDEAHAEDVDDDDFRLSGSRGPPGTEVEGFSNGVASEVWSRYSEYGDED